MLLFGLQKLNFRSDLLRTFPLVGKRFFKFKLTLFGKKKNTHKCSLGIWFRSGTGQKSTLSSFVLHRPSEDERCLAFRPILRHSLVKKKVGFVCFLDSMLFKFPEISLFFPLPCFQKANPFFIFTRYQNDLF